MGVVLRVTFEAKALEVLFLTNPTQTASLIASLIDSVSVISATSLFFFSLNDNLTLGESQTHCRYLSLFVDVK